MWQLFNMWLLLGIVAIITALLNLILTIQGWDTKWLRFISLSFTVLTICAEYYLVGDWALNGDWSALRAVAPAMSKTLWVVPGISILSNVISLFIKQER